MWKAPAFLMLFAFLPGPILGTGCTPTADSEPPQRETKGQVAPEESGNLRILGTVPDFSLLDQTSSGVGLADLLDKVWIANFIFTRCAATCPRQTALLARLQDSLSGNSKWNHIRLVSISVDPEFDTPDVLAAYAQRYGTDAEHWKFLTGTREAIWSLSKDGFKLPVGNDAKTTAMPIFHSPQFILVDQVGQIRGYFDSGDDGVLDKLEESLTIVLEHDEQESD